ISNFNLTMAAPSNLRFAYNVVSYATTSTVFRKDPRRSGASIDGLGAPLVNSWTYNSTTWTGGSESVENSPVIWKNIVFVTSGERLVAFDATPQRDLDMNGLPDDGQTDTGLGYDIIWEFKCGILSSPTVATMVDPKDMTPKDFVMVNCSQGHLHIFETLTSDSKGNISGSPVERTNDLWKHNMGPGNGNLLPPVVANGWIYVVGMDAVVYAYCPVLAASTGPVQPSPAGPVVAQVNTSGSWTLPLKGTANPALEPPVVKFGPTLAIVKNQSTGALVQMLSVIAKPTGSSQGRVVNDHIYSLPIYVYSDRLRPISPSTMTNGVGQAMYQTSYTTFPIADYPKTEVWAVDGAGNSIAVTENHNTVASGMVQITATGGVLLGPGTRVYLSYAIDYSKSNISYTPPYYQLEPGITSVTNGIQMPLEATATPAIGANDMFYMGVVWPDARPGGTTGGTGFSSVYAVYYDGNHSSARLDWTYFLHGGGNIPDPTSGTVNAGGSIPLSSADRSRLWGIHARSKNLGSTGPLLPVKHLEVRGTPAVTNDRVFVTATTNDPGDPGMPKGYLLCFKANPEPVIRLNRPLIDRSNPARERPIDVRLWQPDLMFNPAAAGQPPMLAGSVVPSNMLDREAGTITINNFARLRLQGSVPGTPTGTLSLSLPVWVFLDGQPVPLSEIDLSSWDNLLWALPLPPHERSGADPDAPYRDRVVPCSGCSSSPIVL
ncbi:MAG TPA: hypothetical protein PKV43_06365, partial [Armatimonadota bacterium]|nr:hypothetical protein [Armatimonadota bacterium]